MSETNLAFYLCSSKLSFRIFANNIFNMVELLDDSNYVIYSDSYITYNDSALISVNVMNIFPSGFIVLVQTLWPYASINTTESNCCSVCAFYWPVAIANLLLVCQSSMCLVFESPEQVVEKRDMTGSDHDNWKRVRYVSIDRKKTSTNKPCPVTYYVLEWSKRLSQARRPFLLCSILLNSHSAINL